MPESPDRQPAPPPAASPDTELVDRLRAGDADAFAEIVSAWSPALLRTARYYVSGEAAAADVVQETWLAVVRGLGRFEGRSALRTWVFSILTNQARKRGVADKRTVSLSALDGEDAPAVDPSRFRPADAQYAGGWREGCAPESWGPESRVLAAETRAVLRAGLDGLPPRQREVVVLRDVHGLSTQEVAVALGVSEGNVRVLLHRGRMRLRQLLEDHFSRGGAADA